MKINVSQVSEEDGLSVRHLFPESEPNLRDEDCRIVGRPALSAHATRKGDEVKLTGKLSATFEICCARCLAPIPVTVDEDFELFYLPSAGTIREERELAEEDLLVGFYLGGVIDLDDLVREQVELAVPMARLCREDCKGLCPECGADLNESQCACAVGGTDPRWSALKEWKS